MQISGEILEKINELAELLDNGEHKFNSFEQDFIDNIKDFTSLTDRQLSKIEEDMPKVILSDFLHAP